MRAMRNGLRARASRSRYSKGEWGPGQEEINVRYAEALDMADRHVILKNSVKEIAYSAGKARHLHGEMARRWPARRATSTLRSGT